MSEHRASAMLRIETDPGVEVEVFNHNFEQVGCATDGWVGEVPVGIYNVRFRAGGHATEQLVRVVAAGATVRGTVQTWRSASPTAEIAGYGPREALPMREAKQSEAAMRRWTNATEVGRRERVRAMVFVFVSAPFVHSKEDPARSLEPRSYETGATLDWQYEDRDEAEGWSARLLYDPPPLIRLRYSDGRGRIEQTVPAMDGYCTAVFLEYGRATAKRWGILTNTASVLASSLAREPKAFADHHRYADLALRALDHGGRPISESAGKCLSADPHVDPLTRLYITAHLFERWSPKWSESPPWIRDLAITALHQLASAAPQIPDVRLLQGWAATRGFGNFPTVPVDYPPMLQSVWTAGVQASVHSCGLIPPNVPAARAAAQRCGAGPWLAWRGTPDIVGSAGMSVYPSHPGADVLAVYQRALDAVASADLLNPSASVPGMIDFDRISETRESLTPREFNVLSVLACDAAARDAGADAPRDLRSLASAVEQAAVAFGQPAHLLADTLNRLVTKLK
jgi:hypothetical protein